MTAVLFLLRGVILVMLWGFVIAAVVAVRHDVFGTRRPAPQPASAPARPQRAPDQKREQKREQKKPKGSVARRLVVVEGDLTGQTVALSDSPITLGRADDSTLVLTDDYASTRHARLVPRGDSWLIEDLGSTNGTYLDRQRITAPTPVPVGVPIRIGKTVLELRR
jgi:pSer/pThr/pTyr-binding forkhead associated (FHA) protein